MIAYSEALSAEMARRGGPAARARAARTVPFSVSEPAPRSAEEEEAHIAEALRRSVAGTAAEGGQGAEEGPASEPEPELAEAFEGLGLEGSSAASGRTAATQAKAAPVAGGSAAGTQRAGTFVPQRAGGSGLKFYTFTRAAPSHQHLLGVHRCSWEELRQQLPGQTLAGSGCHCRGFDNPEAAVRYWVSEGWSLPAPRHY